MCESTGQILSYSYVKPALARRKKLTPCWGPQRRIGLQPKYIGEFETMFEIYIRIQTV
jgi:hypothetical protein